MHEGQGKKVVVEVPVLMIALMVDAKHQLGKLTAVMAQIGSYQLLHEGCEEWRVVQLAQQAVCGYEIVGQVLHALRRECIAWVIGWQR
jgi:hypothetical protein